MPIWGPLRRLNGGDAILKNADYLSDADGTAEPDYSKVGPACILKVGPGDYRCWFEGVTPLKTLQANQTGTFDYNTVCCYATSTDGVTFTKRDDNANGITDTIMSVAITPTNPVGGNILWMRGETSPGTVLFDATANAWKMWGHAGNNTGPREIFYAESADGLAWVFQNNGQPVLTRGGSGAWDELLVTDPRVIRVSATSYVMLYRGQTPAGLPKIGRATSPDGITWTKFGTVPVITSGTAGAWDDQAIYPLGLLYEGGVMHGWYGGDANGDFSGQGLGYISSTDLGETWTRGQANPVIRLVAGTLDSINIGDTISAYRESPTAVRIHWGSERTATSPPFRGRLMGEINLATRTIPILGAATLPDASGNVYLEPAAVNLESNDRYPGLVPVFKDTSTRLKLGVRFRVPDNYVGSPNIVLLWATTVTSGKVVWEFDYTAIAAGESADPSADQESTSSTGTTVPGTARLVAQDTIALTAANLAPGDWVEGSIVRDGADTTNDTAAASAYLLGAFFQYADA